ncbi:MAG TPA: chemotaxis protein CheB, partial [Ktedonobacterales bacterium]|nr:chemotaxis protein CheB [Ktedonobacterales bacterium]
MPTRDWEHGIARDIVVIGASAGGVEALTTFVANLPDHLPAALFVVVHIPAEASSTLAQILSRAGPLPATTAKDQAPITHGHIYVAPPDHHLLVTTDVMRVVYGPRENRHRPAIDPLFRSAAVNYGRRVVGIVLSGALNDGTAGLLAIKRAGGIAMVQDPTTAAFPGMPQSALSYVAVDWSLPLPALAEKVATLARGTAPKRKGNVTMEEMDDEQKAEMWTETEIAGLNPAAVTQAPRYGKISSYTCPDCHGPLWEI